MIMEPISCIIVDVIRTTLDSCEWQECMSGRSVVMCVVNIYGMSHGIVLWCFIMKIINPYGLL